MYRDIYKEHKETIERVFANANENHGMRYTRMHGLQKVKMQVTLTSSTITKMASIRSMKCRFVYRL